MCRIRRARLYWNESGEGGEHRMELAKEVKSNDATNLSRTNAIDIMIIINNK